MRIHHTATSAPGETLLTELERFTAHLATLTPPGGVLPEYDAGYARAVRAFTRKLAEMRAERAA